MSVLCALGFHRYKTISIYWKEVRRGSSAKAYKQKECVCCGLKVDEFKKRNDRFGKDLLKEMSKSMHPRLPLIH